MESIGQKNKRTEEQKNKNPQVSGRPASGRNIKMIIKRSEITLDKRGGGDGGTEAAQREFEFGQMSCRKGFGFQKINGNRVFLR